MANEKTLLFSSSFVDIDFPYPKRSSLPHLNFANDCEAIAITSRLDVRLR